MDPKDELEKIIEKEKEYNDCFEDFIHSDEERTFTKKEVDKIIEAHLFKEFLGRYNNNDTEGRKPMKKNILVTSKEIGAKFLNREFILGFFLSYLFYIGFLVLITTFIYPTIIENKLTVFIIALVFTLIEKLVKPFIFFADLISFTFHKIGLVTLTIYTLLFFGISILFGEKVSIEKSIVVALIVLLLNLIIDLIKRDAMIKTKLMNQLDEVGSEEDEDE